MPRRSEARPPERRLRVRARPLAQIDEAKLAVALSLMARRLLEERASAAVAGKPRPQSRGGDA